MTSEYADQYDHPTLRGLRLGRLNIPLNPNGARDDYAGAGEVNAYESGATIVVQISSSTPGTWRSATFS